MILPEQLLEVLLTKAFSEELAPEYKTHLNEGAGGKYSRMYSSRANEHSLQTNRDFEAFADKVARDTGTAPLNVNTWKRVFRHLKRKDGKPYETSEATGMIIAQYLGCDSWEELIAEQDYICKRWGVPTMAFPLHATTAPPRKGRYELMLERLQIGGRMLIRYYPERELLIEKVKPHLFRIVATVNTQLQVGDLAVISVIRFRYPLMITDVIRNGNNLGPYISAYSHVVQSVQIVEHSESRVQD